VDAINGDLHFMVMMMVVLLMCISERVNEFETGGVRV
jgi:hypothetical protein